MALPLPLIEPQTAADTLAGLWQRHTRAAPTTAGPPTLILCLPPAWNNRYQQLLYARAAAHNCVSAGVAHPRDLVHVMWPGPVVLHAHWFASLFSSALSDADARARLAQITAQIDSFAARTGAQLLWTAHNVLPHANNFPETALALRRWVFERFDLLHVMDPSHVPLLEQAYGRDAPQWIAVPHMSYAGAVPDTTDMAGARSHLGLPRGDTVFGAFGSLQGYKNLDTLCAIFTQLADAHPHRPMSLLIGGVPADPQISRRLRAFSRQDPRITLLARTISHDEIQYIHHASDLMVLPYQAPLNSGAALMAATFAKPFVMPRTQSTQALVALGAQLYDADQPDALLGALGRGLDLNVASTSAAIRARSPRAISDAFFTQTRRCGGLG